MRVFIKGISWDKTSCGCLTHVSKDFGLVISRVCIILCGPQQAMKVMSFTEDDISDVLQVISGILQLGNVTFLAAGGAQVSDKNGKDFVLMYGRNRKGRH